MATQNEHDKNPTQGNASAQGSHLGSAQPGPRVSVDDADNGSYGPSPAPESPSWSQLRGSIAPTAQPAAPPAPSRASRSGTIAASFLLGALTAAVLGSIIFSKGVSRPMSAAARFGAPEPPVESPLEREIRRIKETYPVTAADMSVYRRHSGTFTAFDMAQAEEALGESAQVARGCFRPVASDSIEVQVVFSRSGRVVLAYLPDRARFGTDVADCVESAFRNAVISPFEGREVSLTRHFPIAL